MDEFETKNQLLFKEVIKRRFNSFLILPLFRTYISKILFAVRLGANYSYPLPKFQTNRSKNGGCRLVAMANIKGYPWTNPGIKNLCRPPDSLSLIALHIPWNFQINISSAWLHRSVANFDQISHFAQACSKLSIFLDFFARNNLKISHSPIQWIKKLELQFANPVFLMSSLLVYSKILRGCFLSWCKILF